jgi:hypothetical protein
MTTTTAPVPWPLGATGVTDWTDVGKPDPVLLLRRGPRFARFPATALAQRAATLAVCNAAIRVGTRSLSETRISNRRVS